MKTDIKKGDKMVYLSKITGGRTKIIVEYIDEWPNLPSIITSTNGVRYSEDELEKDILDVFHYHEALDRTHCINHMLNELLISHPVFEIEVALKKKLDEASKILWDVYQELGNHEIE